MDTRLVSWARAVKSRGRNFGAALPVVWLFSDAARTPDVLAAVRTLPPRSGVVFRHDGVPGRAGLARAVRAACRAGGHLMVMTAPAIGGVGLHVRAGRRPNVRRLPALVTSSAHSRAEVLRARRLGAQVVFLSPLFETASHVGVRGMGAQRWCRVGLGLGPVWALGGISPARVRGVPSCCAGFGAIGAFAPCGARATVFHDCHGGPLRTVAKDGAARQ